MLGNTKRDFGNDKKMQKLKVLPVEDPSFRRFRIQEVHLASESAWEDWDLPEVHRWAPLACGAHRHLQHEKEESKAGGRYWVPGDHQSCVGP